MSLAYGDTRDSLKNREAFLRTLGIASVQLVCAQQVHGDTVAAVRGADRGRGALTQDSAIPGTDALVTGERQVPLGIFTADCLSVFLYDPLTPAAGIVHAGWKSSRQHITAKAVSMMQQLFHSRPEDLHAWFGPSMRSCCYEVQEEFRGYFPTGVRERDGRHYLDLVSLNSEELRQAGVGEGHIADSGICTSCRRDEYFSFRREGRECGRMLSVIMLR